MIPVHPCHKCGARARNFCTLCGEKQLEPAAKEIDFQQYKAELAQKRAEAGAEGDGVGEYFYGFLLRVAARRP